MLARDMTFTEILNNLISNILSQKHMILQVLLRLNCFCVPKAEVSHKCDELLLLLSSIETRET